jgi:hypothetical protein
VRVRYPHQVALISVLLVALAVWVNSTAWRHRSDRRPPESRPTGLGHVSTVDDNAMQAKCYEQAQSLYRSLGYPKGRIVGFGNHYNQKFATCFLDVMNMESAGPSDLMLYSYLVDVATGKEYAAYTGVVRGKNLSPQGPPQRCEVLVPSGERRVCRSDLEFATLTNVYMEQE